MIKKAKVINLIFILSIPLLYSTTLLDTSSIHRLFFAFSTLVLSIIIFFNRQVPSTISLNKNFVWMSLLLPLSLTISSLVNNSTALLFPDLFLILNYFAFSYLIIILCNIWGFKRITKYSSLSLSITGGAIALIGILQAFGFNILELPELGLPGSTLSSRNFAAEYIVGLFPWVVIAALHFRGKRFEIVFGVVLLIVLFYLFLLRGRAGYVSLLAGIIFFLIFYYRFTRRQTSYRIFRRYTIITGGILLVAIILGFLQLPRLSRRDFIATLKSTVNISHPDNQERLKSWAASVDMFARNPVFGIGTARWAGIYPKYNGADYEDDGIYRTPNINPHNDFLEFLSENGLPAFIFYCLTISISLLYLIRNSRNDISFLLIAVSLFNLVIASLFSFTKDRVAPMIIFYLIVGIAFAFSPPRNKLHFRLKSKLLVGGIFLILLTNALFVFQRYGYEKQYIVGIKNNMNENYIEMVRLLENINQNIFPLDPSNIPVSYYIGVGYFALQKYQSALSHFNNAIKLSPETPIIKNNVASTNYVLNRVKKAQEMYLQLKSTFPNYLEPQVNLLAIYANAGKDSLAIELMNEICSKGKGKKINNQALFNQIKEYYDEKIQN